MHKFGVDIRNTQPGDAVVLAASLRKQDLDEVRACGFNDPVEAIEVSIKSSDWCHTAWDGEQIVCIVGLAPSGTVLTSYGVPWMLGSDLVLTHRRALARAARDYTAAMLRRYPRLVNVVHADNTVAVRWLSRIGFTLDAAKPHPKTGAMFHRFEMRG